MSPARFGVFLPQLRMDYETILGRARAAEAAGYDSVWFMDHMVTPALPEAPCFEGFTLATAIADRHDGWLTEAAADFVFAVLIVLDEEEHTSPRQPRRRSAARATAHSRAQRLREATPALVERAAKLRPKKLRPKQPPAKDSRNPTERDL